MAHVPRSCTAELTAGIRAGHYLHDEHPLIHEDPVAIDLLSPDIRERYLDANEQDRPGQRGNSAVVLGRARYTEDKLEQAVASGTGQYVLLGAGGDSFALRRTDLVDKIRVYEIDQPATQKWKLERLRESGYVLPASLEYLSADLEHETVPKILERSTFHEDQRAFFSWLGTTMYLTPEAIFRTLRSLAGILIQGSEMVFDYRVRAEYIDPAEVDSVLAGDEATAAMGEPKRSFFNPHTLPGKIEATGFEVLENLSPGQLTRRYFAGRRDGMKPSTHHWYVHIGL